MLRILIGLPVLLVLILFALSNQAEVTLALWPTDLSVQTPMAIAILAAAAGAFIIGALFTWFAGIGHRRRARRAESTIRLLEEQVAALKARPMTPAGTGLARLPER
jgi:uncharacterized integral membrane protein